ncbi:GTPase of the mitochondrial inner membrane that associates with the large ribosomal subunit, partial [Coemansia helicoidea]
TADNEAGADDPGTPSEAAAAARPQEQWMHRSRKGGRNFVDRMRCTVAGGHGGNGCVSFLRDAFVAQGPANGGNGGTGGDVWFEVDENETSLSCVKQRLRARPGMNGRGKSMHGPRGGDLVVRVPKGTVVRQVPAAVDPGAAQVTGSASGTDSGDSRGFLDALEAQLDQDARARAQDKAALFVHYPRWEDRNDVRRVPLPAEFRAALHELRNPQPLSLDLTTHGQRTLVARGGLGGFGNPHFISAADRQPHYALRGLPGESRTLELELKTIADVGLVGMPNAGKSTLLGAVSNAHPKVAPYPFTTLNPYIGTVDFRDSFQMTVADIPGLIPGAHRNVGLGHSFLRHIERSRVLVYVVDLSRAAPWDDLSALQRELDLYSAGLSQRPSLVLANKADAGPVAQRNFAQWQATAGLPLVPVSAKFRKNILKATHSIRQVLDAL